jgi:hypothetical protein
MIINLTIMKENNYILSKLNNDRTAIAFCFLVVSSNFIYLYQNDDSYFILSCGSGLERLLNLNKASNSILDMNAYFARIFSYFISLVFFNFIVLMIYNILFKFYKPSITENLLVYVVNILLIVPIFYYYIIFFY